MKHRLVALCSDLRKTPPSAIAFEEQRTPSAAFSVQVLSIEINLHFSKLEPLTGVILHPIPKHTCTVPRQRQDIGL